MSADERILHMHGEGTSVLLGVGSAGVAQVHYWGPELGTLGEAAMADLVRSVRRMKVDNDPDVVVDPGILPGAWTGWTGRPGVTGRRRDGTAWSPRLTTTGLRVDTEGSVTEVFPGNRVETGAGTAVIELADTGACLSATIFLTLGAGGTLRVRATLTNTGEEPYDLDEFTVALPVPLELDEILDATGRWGRERFPQRTEVTFGAHLREGRHGRTGFDHPTLMAVGRRGFDFASGALRALHVAGSANHRTYLERLPEGHQVLGGGELLHPGEVRLGAGETYEGPTLHFVHGDGLDEAAHRVHAWVRSLPSAPGPDRPVTLNVWEAVHFDHSLPKLLALADAAARIGVERYVLDDGWFGARRDDTAGLGDWIVAPDAWPEGLHPLTEHVTALGMQFGLWFEPEMINPDSDTARAHPEWMLSARDELPLPWRHQQAIDLTNPEAWEHVRSQMDAILTEYPVSYIKWDHNRDVFDAGASRDGGRAAVGRQTHAALALMDRLRADHPGLEIESCSSGGGRIDLEMVRHAQRFWASDCIDPHERHSIVRGTEQIIPLEMIGTHVASGRNQTTGRLHDCSFRACTALWGHMGIEWDLTCESREDLDELAQWITFYKANRGLLLTGDVVRDRVGDGTAWIHGVVSGDRSRALYELSILERGPLTVQGRLRLRGLDPAVTYRVRPLRVGSEPSGLVAPPWFGEGNEGVSSTGAQLAAVGLTAPVLHPDQSLLIEAFRIDPATEHTTAPDPIGREKP
ncbi:MAG: alpha-galactosidase [Actinomyces ruminicola]|nr:alpha-galactosidase [Actinomyces ruminicola]